MNIFEKRLYPIAKWLLRLCPIWILLILLYTCFYIYISAPDGGTMLDFRNTVAELLCHAIATLGLLFLAASIPDIELL